MTQIPQLFLEDIPTLVDLLAVLSLVACHVLGVKAEPNQAHARNAALVSALAQASGRRDPCLRLTPLTVNDRGVLSGDDRIVGYRRTHYRAFARPQKLRLHWLWAGLHLSIAVYGLDIAEDHTHTTRSPSPWGIT